jgi:hypothetical protein
MCYLDVGGEARIQKGEMRHPVICPQPHRHTGERHTFKLRDKGYLK